MKDLKPLQSFMRQMADLEGMRSLELSFEKVVMPKCKLCRKRRGEHKADSHHCPIGRRTRAGSSGHFHATNVFTAIEKVIG